MRVIVWLLLLLGVAHSQIVCNTSGNAGVVGSLIQFVVVDFKAPVVSTYQGNELARAFDVSFQSGRPLFVTTAVVSGNLVNLTVFNRAGNFEMQTGKTVRVNYTQLVGILGNLTAGGSLVTTGVKCTTSNDNVRPVIIATYFSGFTTTESLSLLFSEPVRACNYALHTNNLTFVPISEGVGVISYSAQPLIPFGGSPSSVWSFTYNGAASNPGVTMTIVANAVCDASGNPNIFTAGVYMYDFTSLPTLTDYLETASTVNGGFYYDLDGDGLSDSALLYSPWAISTSSTNNNSVTLTINDAAYPVTVFDPEEDAFDNTVLMRFVDTSVTSMRVSFSNTTAYGPRVTAIDVSSAPIGDAIPPFISRITGSYGFSQIDVTVSEAHTSALAASQFCVDVRFGVSIVRGVSSTSSSIVLELSSRVLQDVGIYLKPLTYGVETQGYPLWRTPEFTWLIRNMSISGTPWDTLTVNYTDAAVSSVVILRSLASHSYVVDSETVSGNSAVYKVSRTCVTTTPCLTTSVDFTLNLTGSVATIFNAVVADLSPPVIVGYSVIVGANKIRIQFSETVNLGHTVPFEIHSNGLLATSYTQTGSVFVFTLERAIKASDSSTGWNSLTITDSAGNTATAVVPAIFSVTIAAFSNKLRITTSLPHQSINASMLSTVPFIELGDATRVSDTITDIEATVTSSSVTIEHLGGILLSSGQRSGFELLQAEFPITGEVESTSSDGISNALAGGLIAGAVVVGIGLGYCYRDSSSPKKKRAYQSVNLSD